MTIERNVNFSLLDLGHIEVALEAYIKDAIDARMHLDEGSTTAEERAEFDVIVEEGQALLERVKAAMLG